MDQPRTETVQRMQAHITQNDYRVDPHAVAEALLRRLLDGRTLEPARS